MSDITCQHYPFCVTPSKLYELEDFDSSEFKNGLRDNDLIWVLGYLRNNNLSGNQPYHNNKHMYGVAVIADYLYRTEVAGDMCRVDHVHLIVAALMHDYGHSGGVQDDSVNIRHATSAIQHMYIRGSVHIKQMIAITEYPFKHEPSSISEKCLRDADLLYATLSGDPRIIMEGLRAELAVARAEEIDYLAMVEGQRTFMSSVRLYTSVGQRLFDRFTPSYLDSLGEYARNKQLS